MSKRTTEGQLNNRQRVFVEEYLTCWNASEAARRAGYKSKPNVHGARLLANVSIRALIEQRLATKAMSAGEVLARLADHARGTLDDFIDARGVVDLRKARKAGKAHLLHRYSRTDKGTTIELYDAQAALALLGKHYKLFTERFEHTGKDGAPLNTQVTILIPDNGRGDRNPGNPPTAGSAS